MSLKKIISENPDERYISYIIDKIEQNTSYNLKKERNLSYVGGGSFGKVFKIQGTDKVIRVGEPISKNVDRMDALIEVNFDHVVNYYYYKEIKEGLYEVMVMEELEELDQYIKYTLQDIEQYTELYWFFKNVDITDEKDLMDSIEGPDKARIIDEILFYSDRLIGITKGIKELEDHLIFHDDLRSANIMQDPETEDLKIIDVT